MYICFQANEYAHFPSYACDPKLDLFDAQLRDVIAIARKWTNGGGRRSNREDKIDPKKKQNRSKIQNIIKAKCTSATNICDGWGKSFS